MPQVERIQKKAGQENIKKEQGAQLMLIGLFCSLIGLFLGQENIKKEQENQAYLCRRSRDLM